MDIQDITDRVEKIRTCIIEHDNELSNRKKECSGWDMLLTHFKWLEEQLEELSEDTELIELIDSAKPIIETMSVNSIAQGKFKESWLVRANKAIKSHE